ncbi:VOC family protein [Pseudozobellia sp. WGM2]|uniref:VOC family protein n=1 Tax=Pseudozobellia sp. WGM2 TaxID=2787625 RepID=UPI001ADF3BD8|nr:VOC family protein [Pseudozobellia sp. WGM2]
MKKSVAQVSLLVNNYDEAIEFYTQKLGFKLLEDTEIGEGKRWVTVGSEDKYVCNLLLAKAVNQVQQNAVGNQSGGRVFLFLYTDRFWEDFETMKSKGVEFNEEPREEPYGTVVVFKDLYGNLWDMIQPN